MGYRYGTLAETGAFTSNRLDSPPFTAKRFRSIAHTQTLGPPGADASEGLAGLDLDCADKGRVLSRARSRNLAAEGDMVVACGMRFYVV